MNVVEYAPIVALVCAAVAIVVVAVLAVGAIRAYFRLRRVSGVALDLVDLHTRRLEDAVLNATQRTATVTERSEDLAAAVSTARCNIDELVELATAIQRARDEFYAALRRILVPNRFRALVERLVDA